MNGLPGGEEGAVGDDVLLHLGGAGADRRVALERVQARPRAAVDGIGAALGEQPRRSEQVDRQLGERLSQVAPLQLRQRDLGPVLLALDDLGQRPVVEELRVLDVRERPGDALTDLGIAQRVGVGGLGGRDHRAQVRRHRDREPGGADALVPERAHRDLPALAFLAEPTVGRDAGVGEPHLVEELVAGDVADRAAFDPRRVHIDDERGDALVLGAALDCLRVRPQQEQAPVGEMRRRDPDLLAIHHVLVAVADGCCAQVRQVGARFRLAEPLAPVLRRVEDAGQPTLLLLVGAPLDDHGADLPDAVGVVDARRAHARALLGVDDVLDRRRLAPTPVLGPVDRGPPALVEPALPVLPALLAARDALRETVRAFLAREAPGAYVREMADDERGFTDPVWDKLAELEWPGLLVPEANGGLGLGLVDMAVVMEEMGRLPFPGPFFSSAVFATLAVRRLDDADLLAQLASGAIRGTVALEELGHDDPVDRVHTRARRKGADWVLTGQKPLVLDGHTADWVIVVARTEDGVGSFLLEAPRGETAPTMDPTRKAARLVLAERRAVPLGPRGDQTALWRRVVDDASVMLAAELIGACDAALQLATDYAKVRVQFDRPIATFQAIRHKAVDMLHKLELARVGTHYAAWASDVDDPSRERAAAMAKGFVAEAAVFISGEDIQIHGGVGFTWDCDAHLYYKRAKMNDAMLGYQGWQRRRLADLVLDGA